jgi:hypothetical protein
MMAAPATELHCGGAEKCKFKIQNANFKIDNRQTQPLCDSRHFAFHLEF